MPLQLLPGWRPNRCYKPLIAETHSIMNRFLSLTGVFVLAALAVADEPRSPAPGQPKVEVKSGAHDPAPIPSPHARQVRTGVASDETKRQGASYTAIP
jgi:hypothetical protein